MRIKHVKDAHEKIDKSKYIIKDPTNYKTKYKTLFGNDNPIYLEIGMGKGNFIINSAIKNPNINYIGIERYDSVLVRAVDKLEDKDIKNLKLIRMNAIDVDLLFDNEIDRLYLNFSDPWPKDRHAKRRLTSEIFLEKYEKILKNKQIIMKTDNRKLFEYSLINLNKSNYKINKISLDLESDQIKDNIETEYEIKFKEKGFPIYMVDASK